ncbi:hypothetical protein [Cyanothece sp. BG0011]|nr:hypothetical protein [Cyanothece sp. BG0011]
MTKTRVGHLTTCQMMSSLLIRITAAAIPLKKEEKEAGNTLLL